MSGGIMIMKINQLQTGMIINLGCCRHYNYKPFGRVETVAFDWAVIRCDDNNVYLLLDPDEFELYKEEQYA